MHIEMKKECIRNTQKKRGRFFRCILLILMIFAMAISSGCRKNTDMASEETQKKIKIGIDKFEPYTYMDINGEYTGVDVDIATIILGKLGYEPEFQFISWNDKNTYLEDGTIDCIWSCYSMNGREDDYQWAGPYLYSRQVVAVRSDSAIQTLADLAGREVGVQATTRAASLFLHETESTLPEVKQVDCFASTDDMFAAIRKGYVDAISGHEALLNEFITNGRGEYRLLEESPHISKAGIAFEKGTHEELAQQIDTMIQELSKDGTISSIVEKYGLDAEKVVVKGEVDEK